MDFTIVREKLDQAVALLTEQNLDAWLTFTRETSLTPDPCLDLIVGLGVTWQSAFLLTRSGERIAIVGRYDADSLRAVGGYTSVVGYDQSIWPALNETLARLDPQTIAINYSESDAAADGLTYGLRRALTAGLTGTAYADRLVSAEGLIAALRGRKSPAEVARLKTAIASTEKIFKRLTQWLKTNPRRTERQIAAYVDAARDDLSLAPAWDAAYCPVVNAGPASAPGHALPGAHKLAPGHLLHLDFGVRQAGYCADLQRNWYVLAKGERRPPAAVQAAWEACWDALDTGAAALKPGVAGWEVDAAARATLVDAGYPEYQHCLGHQLGRMTHDGATVLGPRWDRYGQTPFGLIEPGQIFTLELGVAVPGHGFIGLEEDVRVTARGLEWLSRPQRKLWLV